MIQDGAEDVTAVIGFDGGFDGFGNRAAEASARAGIRGEYFSSDFCRFGRARDYIRAVSPDNGFPERFLLVRDFDHIDRQIHPEIGASHGESRPPLTRPGFGREFCQALFFAVINLSGG